MIAHLLFLRWILMGKRVLCKHSCLKLTLTWSYLQVYSRRLASLIALPRLLTRKLALENARVLNAAQLSQRLVGTDFGGGGLPLHFL